VVVKGPFFKQMAVMYIKNLIMKLVYWWGAGHSIRISHLPISRILLF